jgi:glycolate oxidase iron-sulfur subunit
MSESTLLPARAGAFDAVDTPDQEALRGCVHCGICLPACPTYRVLGQEMDSPRGRLYLMQAAAEGRIGITDNFVLHMDRCLGCRGCESSCPSGVPFGRLLEEVRGQIERKVERPASRRLLRRAVLSTFPSRRRMAMVLAVARLYEKTGLKRAVRATGLLRPFPRLAAMERLLPKPGAARAGAAPPRAAGPRRGTVALLEGCVQALLFPEVNAATARLLDRAGYTVLTPPRQDCCGALHLHWGDREAARRLARANLAAFGDAEWIVTNAAGCGTALRDYGHLLAGDPAAAAFSARVRDVSELLAAALPEPRQPLPLTVTYHEPCHLAHGQRVREAPRTLLRSIPGLRLVELTDADLCCGSAGVYNLLEPTIAGELLRRKLDRIAETGAEVVASGNPGCLLQLRMGLAERGLAVRAHHPVELLDWSVNGRPA